MKPLRETTKRWLYQRAVYGRLRPLARISHGCALKIVLATFAISGRAKRRQVDRSAEDVTAVIKTFERPKRCQALIDSIRRFYPNMRIVVIDDSRSPVPFSGAETIILPFDSGVAAGRNAGLAAVETEFMVNLDDDFVFCHRTALAPAVAALKLNTRIDIMGGSVLDLPLLIRHDYTRAGTFPTQRMSVIAPGTKIGGYEVYDKVPNFFVARSASIRQVGWDNHLKRLDHADFFSQAKGKLVTVFNPKLEVLHVRDPFDYRYLKFRLNVENDVSYLHQKYGTSS